MPHGWGKGTCHTRPTAATPYGKSTTAARPFSVAVQHGRKRRKLTHRTALFNVTEPWRDSTCYFLFSWLYFSSPTNSFFFYISRGRGRKGWKLKMRRGLFNKAAGKSLKLWEDPSCTSGERETAAKLRHIWHMNNVMSKVLFYN